MEEASEDASQEKKKTVWERFKAFFVRMKEWLFGLFKKKTEEATKRLPSEADLKQAAENLKPDVAMQQAEEKHNAAKTEAPAKPAAQATPQPAAQAKPAAATPIPPEAGGGDAKSKAVALFGQKAAEITEKATALIDTDIRKFFAGSVPDIMKIVMSAKGTEHQHIVGSQMEKALSDMAHRLNVIGRTIAKATRSSIEKETAEVLAHELGDPLDIGTLTDFLNNTQAGDQWVRSVDKQDHKSLMNGFNRYCGYVLNIATVPMARQISFITKAVEETSKFTDEFIRNNENSENADVELVRKLQEIYTREIAPIASAFNKILSVYVNSCEQATKFQHYRGRMISLAGHVTKQVIGEEQFNLIDWRVTVGAMCNKITNV